MRRRSGIIAALATLLALTGCGDDGADGTGGESGPSDPPSRTAPTSGTTPPAQPGRTAPGAELALGDTATVPVRVFKDPVGGTATIRVTAIESVSAEDVAASGLSRADDVRIVLVRAEARLTDVDDLRIFDPQVDLVPMAGAEIAIDLSPEDAALFDCRSQSEASPAKGDRVEICKAVEVGKDAEVDRVLFAPYAGDYSVREGAPVTWAG